MTPDEAFQALDHLPLCVGRIDPALRLTYANRQLCAAVARRPEEVVGRTCGEVGLMAGILEPWEDGVREVFRTGRPGRFATLTEVAGHSVYVQCLFSPEVDAAGAVRGVLAAATVNEEVGRLRGVLADQEMLFRQFLDCAPAIAWLRDSADRYVLVNKRYLKHYGLSLEDALGKTPADRWPADVAARFLENDARVVASGEPEEFAESAPDPDGSVHTWLNVKFPFADASGARYVGGIGVDITERERREEERRGTALRLQQAEKLQSLGLLASGVAHDFNNILTGILGEADLLRTLLPAGSAAMGHLDFLVRQGERASELCEQLMASAGQRPPTCRPHDLAGLVAEAADLVRRQLADLATLHLDFAPDLPPAWCDGTQIRQLVMNLLLNAGQAQVPGDGPVPIRARGRRSLADPARLPGVRAGGNLPAGEWVRLEVADEGAGMPADVLARLFDPFFTTKATGRGLGLATVLSVAQAHRAALAVVSTPGAGTTFTLLLPLA